MVTVFVMAQGQQQRIGHMLGTNGLPAWKQLLKISETETILARCCRLFRAAGADVVIPVVHWDSGFVNACMDLEVPFIVQRDPGASVLNGIFNVRRSWGARTVIALGDVVYSKDAVGRMLAMSSFSIFERPGKNVVTGNPYPERFGICFGTEDHGPLLEVLERPGFRTHADHKLIHLKEHLAGHMGIQLIGDYDYTDDVDTEEALKKRLPKLVEAAAADV